MFKLKILLVEITILFFLILSLSSFVISESFERLSIDFVAKTLKSGKSVTTKGVVYYQVSQGKLVTKFDYPTEFIVFSNASGDLKSYDISENMVKQDIGEEYSSKNSYIYSFLNGLSGNMGLKDAGYNLKSTNTKDGMIVTEWVPQTTMKKTAAARVQFVKENNKPIFIGYFDIKNKPLEKIYFSKFENIVSYPFPMTIVEIQFLPKGDSIITKRTFSGVKLNGNVDKTYLEYKIPSNAKVVR